MPASAVARTLVEGRRRLGGLVGPRAAEARRSLPVRRSADEIRALWEAPVARAAVLDGLPVSQATLETGGTDGWGTTATIVLRLDAPLPRTAAQTLAGRAVRRLKALAETGETPSTERNPSARAGSGEVAR